MTVTSLAIGVFGGLGRMGSAVVARAPAHGIEVSEIIDRRLQADGVCPKLKENPDWCAEAYLDFTTPEAFGQILSGCVEHRAPLVCGTTGLSAAQFETLAMSAEKIAVVYDTNMSLGVTVLRELVRKASLLRGMGFDCELVEAHHRHKKDAPSGTAKSLLQDIGEATVEHGRNGPHLRSSDEVGVHAIRMGGVLGEHSVYFASENEIIELRHSLISRNALADGALLAAKFVVQATPGLYSMADVWSWRNTNP
ncbi:MAG: hypothetical protein Kow00107_04320 [Planctomycetota bacterium]